MLINHRFTNVIQKLISVNWNVFYMHFSLFLTLFLKKSTLEINECFLLQLKDILKSKYVLISKKNHSLINLLPHLLNFSLNLTFSRIT